MQNKMITKRSEDFARWYTDVVAAASLAAYSPVKGSLYIEPNGYALWESIQKVLDRMFKETGHKNVAFPLLIPKSLLEKEADLIEGFAPEVAWVTKGGDKELDEMMAIRPTSETMFCDYYSKKISSYRDLPQLLNQWCSIYRWEKESRPFLRSREIIWQEGHTMHETAGEAEEETRRMLNIYDTFFRDYLAIPTLTGKKTEKEKFAGAKYTYTVETMMQNGIALQSGTSHYFGQNFTKAYDVKFTGRDNKESYPYQTSWGVSTRIIAAIIMVHADDNGLILPPRIAPYKLVITEIRSDENVKREALAIKEMLDKAGITTLIDDTDKAPGFKFAEAEVNGYPLRLEIGPRDVENNEYTLVRRDNREKIKVSKEEIVSKASSLLNDIHEALYEKAKANMLLKIKEAHTKEEFLNITSNGNYFIKAMHCGCKDCEEQIQKETGLKTRCIPFTSESIDSKCVYCGKEAKYLVYFGKQY